MRAVSLPLLAASLTLAAPALAQAPAAPAPAAQPTKEQIEDAAYEMRVFMSALQSDKIEAPAKDALFQCIYSNSFAKLSEAIGQVAAQNVGKFEKRNADHVLSVMLRVCGFTPQPAAGAATPAPAPATPATPPPAGAGR